MSYNADSIELRSFREAAQSTPGMYLGDDGQGGVFNAFMEILNNSCDEAIMGRGRRIEVYLEDNDNKVTVVDYGAGIPRGPKGDIPEILIELFTAAHSSGKFNSNNYKKVRGIHGVGQSATCVTSEYFVVNVKRDGYRWELEFDNGIPRTETAVRKEATKETGTEISFYPNKRVFHIADNAPAFDAKRIEDELHLTSFFIPEVEFIFHRNGKKKTFYSKNGLKDFAAEKIKDPLHKGYIYGYKEFEDEVEIEVFAQWTLGKEKSYVFSNGALNSEGGSPIAGARSAFTRTVNSLSKKSFDGDAIRKGLVYIINIRHPHPIYSNQVKTKIQNPELRGYTQTVFTEALKDFARDNRKDFEKVVEILEKDQKADAAAERARKQVLEATRDIERNQKRKVFSSDKLKDAEVLGEGSTLLLVEGNSAAASLAIARDPKKYGILALRGKSLNPLSNTEEKALQNEEIKLILSALGVTPGKYNPKKLRYGKIGIASDADSDGMHIALLIMAILHKFSGGFIEDGRLYWLKSPLYIRKLKNKEYYYYSDSEFDNAKEKGGVVKRVKGLGGLNAEEGKRSLFGEQQRLEQLVADKESLTLLEELMGEDVEPRRKFVFNKIDFSEVRE